MIQAGIIGGSGYTGGELIRILLNHSKAEVNFVYSTTKAGLPISDAHEDLLGLTDLKFTSEINPDVDVLFLFPVAAVYNEFHMEIQNHF